MDSRAAIQQFLEWFNIDRKMERIVWSWLKRSEVKRKREAEEMSRHNRIVERLDAGEVVSKRERMSVVPPEPGNVGPVISFCPRCGSAVRGTTVGSCSKQKASTFGTLTFYRECGACTYYSEMFKKRNRYTEVEGG
jgi:hypothetical protein